MASCDDHASPPPTDADLAALRADVFAARQAVANERGADRHSPGMVDGVAADLLASLEAYATALELRNLPLPRRMRDELRLRRHLSR